MSQKKKIIFCTYSSIYSSKVLEPLLADDEIDVVAIINSTQVLSPFLDPFQGALKQIKVSGLRYAFYLFLVTNGFRILQPLFSLKRWPLRSVHRLAKQYGVPVLDTIDINREESIQFIEKYQTDFVLCAHFNQLLKSEILEINNIDFINIHPSLLPSYKGVDPVFFAMKDQTVAIGVSLHRMNEAFDTGELLGQMTVQKHSNKSLLFNNCQLFEEGVRLASTWIKSPKKIKSPLYVNDNEPNNYDSWPTRIDVKVFKNKGKRFMSLFELWNQQ